MLKGHSLDFLDKTSNIKTAEGLNCNLNVTIV